MRIQNGVRDLFKAVWNQSAATWLCCHRRVFEWFGAVPRRVTIDNAKCAITKH